MGLNKSKGNMYEWITHTWNPLAGECPHRCSYCSTNKLMRYPAIMDKYNGKPRLQGHELLCNLGEGNFIFVAAQNDLFASEIPAYMIRKILGHCYKYDNKYLFQTKNPKRLFEFETELRSLDFVLCTTIETNRHYDDIMRSSPPPEERADCMNELWAEFGYID